MRALSSTSTSSESTTVAPTRRTPMQLRQSRPGRSASTRASSTAWPKSHTSSCWSPQAPSPSRVAKATPETCCVSQRCPWCGSEGVIVGALIALSLALESLWIFIVIGGRRAACRARCSIVCETGGPRWPLPPPWARMAAVSVCARLSCSRRGRVPSPHSGVVRQSAPVAWPCTTLSSRSGPRLCNRRSEYKGI